VAQPLPSEPPRLREAPDLTVTDAEASDAEALGAEALDGEQRPPVRLLQEPPERKVTGPRPRPGLRKRPVADETPLPARGAGMTITSYLIAGLLAYGLIGWLIGRAVHLEILTAVGMLIGLGISMALIIYRYGRSTPPRIYRFAPKTAAPDQSKRTERAYDNDARGTDR
jgi:ATP synthase protein I